MSTSRSLLQPRVRPRFRRRRPARPRGHTHPPRRCGSSSRRRPGFEDSAGADTRWSSRTLKKVPARAVVSTMSIVGVQGFTAWIIEFGTPSTPDLLPQEPNRQRAQYRFSRRRRRAGAWAGSDRIVSSCGHRGSDTSGQRSLRASGRSTRNDRICLSGHAAARRR